MFIIYGRKRTRIKRYTDNKNYCKECRSFDLSVKVYQEYFHLFYIPFLPTGIKTAGIYCNDCGQPFRADSVEKEYVSMTRNPVYLYSGLILVGVLVLLMANENIRTQKEKRKMVENPAVGDVYRVRKDIDNTTSYYFLKAMQIKGDTVLAYHSNLVYNGFVTKLSDEDFFVKDEKLVFIKQELKAMLEKDEINAVVRNYGAEEGFDRVR